MQNLQELGYNDSEEHFEVDPEDPDKYRIKTGVI